MDSAQEALRWREVEGMLQDRFVDHPKLPGGLRHLVLPLQEVGAVVCACLCEEGVCGRKGVCGNVCCVCGVCVCVFCVSVCVPGQH
jgi:hypothetical protein